MCWYSVPRDSAKPFEAETVFIVLHRAHCPRVSACMC